MRETTFWDVWSGSEGSSQGRVGSCPGACRNDCRARCAQSGPRQGGERSPKNRQGHFNRNILIQTGIVMEALRNRNILIDRECYGTLGKLGQRWTGLFQNRVNYNTKSPKWYARVHVWSKFDMRDLRNGHTWLSYANYARYGTLEKLGQRWTWLFQNRANYNTESQKLYARLHVWSKFDMRDLRNGHTWLPCANYVR